MMVNNLTFYMFCDADKPCSKGRFDQGATSMKSLPKILKTLTFPLTWRLILFFLPTAL